MGGDEGWKREAFGEHSIIGGDQFVNERGDRRLQTADRGVDGGPQTAKWTMDDRPWTVGRQAFQPVEKNTLRVFVTLWFIFI
jgi:hypothetical protein